MKNRLVTLLLMSVIFAGCTNSGGDDDDSSASGDPLRTNTCGDIGLNTKIINGTPCQDSRSPVVSLNLFTENGQGALCSGTFLSSTHILTAAHCFEDVATGVAVLPSGPVPIKRVVAHPKLSPGTTNYDGKTIRILTYDLAIVELVRSVSTPTLPILGSRTMRSGENISIFGFGLTEKETVGELRSGEMRSARVDEALIIAEFNGQGSNTCNGDSGGPVAVLSDPASPNSPFAIVGVTSAGTSTSCKSGDISLFANAHSDESLNWIARIVPNVRVL